MLLKLKDFNSNEILSIYVNETVGELVEHDLSVGFYSRLGDCIIGLFVAGKRLLLWWDSEILEVNRCNEIKHIRKENIRKFSLNYDSKVYEITYKIYDDPVSTQFYSENEEDVDFGLWICNVLCSEERISMVEEAWADGV